MDIKHLKEIIALKQKKIINVMFIEKDMKWLCTQKKSKTIYKLNLQDKSDEYEECITNKDIFENNGKLYTSVEGIEKRI